MSERIVHKIQHQIITNIDVCDAMKDFIARASNKRQKGTDAPRKRREKRVVKAVENKNGSSLRVIDAMQGIS